MDFEITVKDPPTLAETPQTKKGCLCGWEFPTEVELLGTQMMGLLLLFRCPRCKRAWEQKMV